jgi:hypothetical protein
MLLVGHRRASILSGLSGWGTACLPVAAGCARSRQGVRDLGDPATFLRGAQ